MVSLNMVQAINLALLQEMQKDTKVLLLGEDIGVDGGVFRVTDGLYEKFGPKRVIDTPLAESGIVGTAIGLALSGLKPVAEIQFDGFIYPAFDQLISHAARFRTRTRGNMSCPLVVRAPYGGGIRALEHHSESMEALYMHTPGLKVVIPATPKEAKGLLTSAIRDPDPVLFLEPKRIYRAIKEEVPEEEYTLPLGQAAITQEGVDVTIIAYGAMLREVVAAQEKTKASCEIVNLRSIFPLDSTTIINSVKKTGRCVIVHEGPRTGGVAAEIIARINEKALFALKGPIKRVTGYDTIMPLYQREKAYLPNATKITHAIEEVMQYT